MFFHGAFVRFYAFEESGGASRMEIGSPSAALAVYPKANQTLQWSTRR